MLAGFPPRPSFGDQTQQDPALVWGLIEGRQQLRACLQAPGGGVGSTKPGGAWPQRARDPGLGPKGEGQGAAATGRSAKGWWANWASAAMASSGRIEAALAAVAFGFLRLHSIS